VAVEGGCGVDVARAWIGASSTVVGAGQAVGPAVTGIGVGVIVNRGDVGAARAGAGSAVLAVEGSGVGAALAVEGSGCGDVAMARTAAGFTGVGGGKAVRPAVSESGGRVAGSVDNAGVRR